jgi:arabinofuranosyltransferase
VGHSQEVPLAWDLAQYAAPLPSDAQPVLDARAALGCGQLEELRQAITGPLTPRRFLRNLVRAPSLTRLRIPADPAEARRRLCGPAG